jgi:hypothetical protein
MCLGFVGEKQVKLNLKAIRISCCGLLALAAVVVASSVSNAQDLTGVKCILNGKKSAKASAFVDYQGGKVYFCCGNCVKAFKADMQLKDKAKHTAKANHQLVVTGQFTQKGCPISGGAVNASKVAEIGGAKVAFCCGNCLGKVNSAQGLEAKADLVFSKAAFAKGFEKKKAEVNLASINCMLMKKRKVVETKSVDYKDGKVYFCCGRCVKKYSGSPAKFETLANHQLVASGQYHQIGCPISGGDVDDDQTVVVGGVTVKLCCEKCKAKVEGAASEEAKIELVFGKKRFDKAFSN